jgi:hypothetical protein
MSFTSNKNNQEKNELNETNSESPGLVGRLMPYIPLIMEEFTGQKMKMSGTIGDILSTLQRLESKFDNFAKNCEEQFIHQEQQLASLQQISRLVSTKTEKAIEFAPAKIKEFSEDV